MIRKSTLLILTFVCVNLPALAGTLEDAFNRPALPARPQVYWEWLNGNISREGITADIEAMAANHVEGAVIFPIAHEKAGPVRFMSEEWIELFLHSVREADRCGTWIGVHNGAGWSCAGGPWIDPEHNMQILTSSRIYVEGGATRTLTLPRPWANLGYYHDVAVIAYPSGPVMTEARPTITASSPIDGALLMDGRPDTQITLPPVAQGGECFLQVEFPAPVQVEGLWLTHFGSPPGSGGEVQVLGEDGVFGKIARFDYSEFIHFNTGQSQVTFAPVSGRVFRIKFDQSGGVDYHIGELDLAMAPTLTDILPKAGYYTPVPGAFTYDWDASRPDGPTIPSGQVIDLTEAMDDQGNLSWTPPEGHWTVLRIGQTASGVEARPKPDGITALEVDKLSRAAVKIHYDGFAGRLAGAAGPLTGEAYKYVLNDSWEVGSQNWTAGLRGEFRKRRGYDMTPFMPLLLTGRVVDDVETSERFLEDFRRTLQDLILENYFGYMAELCHGDGLEFWSENYHTMFCDTLDIAGKVDVAMAEFWANYVPDQTALHWIARQASSTSQVYGQPLAPAEAFTTHLDRWTESPKTLKAKGDLMFTGGINQFVIHRYAHQPWLDRLPGMTMGPNGTHFERTSTWWNEGAQWVRYLERCQSMLQQGTVAGDVVVLMPRFEPLCMSAVEGRYQWLKRELPAGVNYLFCSQDGLLEKGRIEGDTLRFPLGEGNRLVVMPDTRESSPELLAMTRRMLEAGITVYATRRPDRALGLEKRNEGDQAIQQLAAAIWGDVDGEKVTRRQVGKGWLVQGEPLVEATLLAGIRPDFDFANADGTPMEVYNCAGNVRPVNAIHRRADGCEVYFVANHTPRAVNLVCRFRVAGMAPERWDPVTGGIEKLAAWRERDGMTELPLDLTVSGSAFIVFRPAAEVDPVDSVKLNGRELFPVFSIPAEAVAVAPGVVDNFTMAAWVKAGSAIDLPAEKATGVYGDPGRYAVYPVPGHEVFGENQAGAGFTVAANGITVMEHGAGRFVNVLVYPMAPGPDWIHVAVVYRDRTPTLYVNGRPVRTGLRGPMDVHPGVGVKHGRALTHFDGSVAGLSCFDHPLDETEIAGLMRRTRMDSDPMPVWRLTAGDGGVPELATDMAGNYSAMTADGKPLSVDVPALPRPVAVAGPWQVAFEDGRGAPASAEFADLISWSDHPDEGIRFYSGHAMYRNTIEVGPELLGKDRRVILDLGGVEVIAQVWVNGHDCGILWHEPYAVDVTEALTAGKNELAIRVVNLWPNRIIGDLRHPEAKPFTYSQSQLYAATDALLPSGLLGPVVMRPVARVDVSGRP